jgi:hypothetical protein
MCLRRAPEKYIAGAALDRTDVYVQQREEECMQIEHVAYMCNKGRKSEHKLYM